MDRVTLHKRSKTSYTVSIPSIIASTLEIEPGMKVQIVSRSYGFDVSKNGEGFSRRVFVIGRAKYESGVAKTLGFTVPIEIIREKGWNGGEEFKPEIAKKVKDDFVIRYTKADA